MISGYKDKGQGKYTRFKLEKEWPKYVAILNEKIFINAFIHVLKMLSSHINRHEMSLT